MNEARRSGILLHPTSLPGPHGTGEFGQPASDFLDFLATTEQSFWQVLPLNPVEQDGCPYRCCSAVAGSPLLISAELLVKAGLLDRADVDGVPEVAPDVVDYAAASSTKTTLLRRAYTNFVATSDFRRFCERQAWWLDDYASYMAARRRYGKAPTSWPAGLSARDPAALAELAERDRDELEYYRFEQYVFDEQYSALKSEAADLGIDIMGDIAMFVGLDSADVWAHRNLFRVDDKGIPTAVAGAPPDYFSEDGQVWGNALYNWDSMAADGYGWWLRRMRRASELFDVLRLDHFRGFQAYWEIPAGGAAVDGSWREGPGRDLFASVRAELGDPRMVADDLGSITPEVERLRTEAGLPGMRVLQFAFAGDDNVHLPHNYTRDSVAYTGTHDNDTTLGWWESTGDDERGRVLGYLGTSGKDICWELARAAFSSVADLVILPMQDLLRLSSGARMNTPGREFRNWEWRYSTRDLTPSVELALKRLTETYKRARPRGPDRLGGR